MNRTIRMTSAVFFIALVGVGVAYYSVKRQQAQSQGTLTPAVVTSRHLTAEVNVSGTVKASDTVDLAFKTGGIVALVPVITGDAVATGTALMILQSARLTDQMAQALANQTAQTAKLNDLKKGTRPEQIAITQANLQSAQIALTNAEQALFDALANAQTVTDVTVRFTIDQFITNPAMTDSQFTVSVSDNTLGPSVLAERRQIDPDLSSWRARIGSLQGANADGLLAASAAMHAHAQNISTILNGLTKIFATTAAQPTAASQAVIASARTAITSANDALTAADQNVRTAQAAISVTQKQISLEKAGATSDAVAGQQAAVNAVRAQVAGLTDELRDQSVLAPFSGIITDVIAKPGEIVATGETVVSMISNGPLKVEGYVPEVHYSKIAVGQSVRVQLDAFPGVTFPGTLGLIDPVASLRDGVPNFKVTIYFINPDPRVKPGLTANAFIGTSDKPKVLAIPLAAVTGVGADATVLRLIGSTTVRTPVTLGITGVDGYIEVMAGLAEGDTVLVNETKQYRIVPN